MREEKLDKILRAKSGCEESLSALVSENIALVKSIAKRFVDRGVDFDDLVQIGTIGLIRAIRGYNEEFNTELSTYAVPMITGEIKRFLRDDGLVKVGRETKRLGVMIKRFASEFEARNGRSPTTDEISECLNVSGEDIVFALEATQPPSALEWDGEDGESHVLSIGVDTVDSDIERFALREALSRLTPDEEKLIRLRYYKGLTQEKTARLLGMTQVKVSREEKKICAKLKTWLE